MSIIQTERLVLRPFTMSDLDSTHEYASDLETTKYMIYLPNRTIQETENFLRRVTAEWNKPEPEFYEFAVTLDGVHIGAVSVYHDKSKRKCVLGWILNKKYHDNGYATEAAKAALRFAIDELKVKTTVAYCDYRNRPSISVMQKIGLSLKRDDRVRRYNGSDEDVRELEYSLILK